MNNNLSEELISKVLQIVKQVGFYIKEELGKVQDGEIEEKELNSLVSYVDKTAEEMLVPVLADLIPGCSFITEEGTVEQSSTADYQWIIDPLDGTSNFLHQIPYFAVSVALRYQGVVVFGVVYNIMQDECFYAQKGKGAFMNDKRINVSKKDNLNQAILATGFPYSNEENTDPLVECIRHWIKHARGIRRLGAAALDLCFVACGRLDFYYETTINIWDIAAGVIIVEEAGGQISDFYGADDYFDKKMVIASNGNFHDEIRSVIEKCYQEA